IRRSRASSVSRRSGSSGPSCPVLEGAAAHVALGAEAGPPLYLKARRSQGPADMARRGVGREAAAGRGVAGGLGHEPVAPELGVLRGGGAVEGSEERRVG